MTARSPAGNGRGRRVVRWIAPLVVLVVAAIAATRVEHRVEHDAAF